MAVDTAPANGPDGEPDSSASRPWALVVGGSGGLGAGICQVLAGDGWNLVVTYRSGKDEADRVVKEARSRGGDAMAVRMDLAAPAELKGIVDGIAAGRRLSVLVYAAGPYVPQRYVSTIGWAQFRDIMLQDAVGCFALVEAALPYLRESRGALVALTSTAVSHYAKRDVLSASPKASVELLMKAVAAEEGRFGIRANCVAVGIVEGGMYDELVRRGDLSPQVLEEIRLNLPLQRHGSVVDVANAVAFLASAKSGWITGQSLHVDGGHSL